jgi:hypothetical protein
VLERSLAPAGKTQRGSALSADGSVLGRRSCGDGDLRLWDLDDRELARTSTTATPPAHAHGPVKIREPRGVSQI